VNDRTGVLRFGRTTKMFQLTRLCMQKANQSEPIQVLE
jgi:hypothetical protein